MIVAAQAPHAAPLVRPSAPAAADALAQLTYGTFLSVAVQTSEREAMPWDGLSTMGAVAVGASSEQSPRRSDA